MNEKGDTLVLETLYLPDVPTISLINKFASVAIQADENYQKQTGRNRTFILSSNGILPLVIPVKHHTRKIREAEIDYSQSWLKNHMKAISSCYRHAPYYEYYFPYFEEIYLKEIPLLFDLNFEFLILIRKMVRSSTNLLICESFDHVSAKNYIDKEKSLKRQQSVKKISIPYRQVFGNTFTPGLSVIDLLFNMGPDSNSYL